MMEKDKIINKKFPLIFIPNNHKKFVSIYRWSEKKITFLYELSVYLKNQLRKLSSLAKPLSIFWKFSWFSNTLDR